MASKTFNIKTNIRKFKIKCRAWLGVPAFCPAFCILCFINDKLGQRRCDSILIFRIGMIGFNCRSYFAKLYCFGFSSAIFIYIIINMSMVLGMLPIVGSPLPIMSYGGSSMLSTMIGLSIVMSCRIYKKELIA